MQEGHLERIRLAELESVREHFHPGMRVLELGGGSGFQASILSSWGCDITSIDFVDREPPHENYFPVQNYDGKRIPFPDSTFDVVFSSNVLEHVPDVAAFLKEIRRVLKSGGTSLHILPSTSWRFWTSATHYVYALRWLFGIQPRVPGVVEPVPVGLVAKRLGVFSVIKQLILAGPHGEYPTAVSELYYYSRKRWRRVFEESGLHLTGIQSCGIFHTGYAILPSASIHARKRMARWLGSSCFAVTAKSINHSGIKNDPLL